MLPSTHIHVMHAMQEGIAMVLGTCFRLLANSKNSDSVTNTAAATVRQVFKQYSWLFRTLESVATPCRAQQAKHLIDKCCG